MEILLKTKSGFQIAECAFAGRADLDALRDWRRKLRREPDQSSIDALEFADLARKRWRSYAALDRMATSIEMLQSAIATDTTAECAMFVAIRARVERKLLRVGFCLFRRTWCNHIVVDLLAVDPSAALEFKGTGTAILYVLTNIAEVINAPCIWGEATQVSAPFYRKVFSMDSVDDMFRIERESLRQFRSRYRAWWRQSGLPIAQE